MPTAPSDTFTGAKVIPYYRADKAQAQSFKFPNSTTVVGGTLVGEITATPGSVKPYASANTDGSQVPIGVCMYDVTVDAAGNHTWGGGTWGEQYESAPVYTVGQFLTTDLVGLDAAALTNGKWRLLHGTVASGVVEIP
jgi:hypothetical protein